MSTDFLQVRLLGHRFDEHAVPFEVLRDFVGLEELLVELARRIHLSDHPERQRAARGLRGHFQIGLAQVTEGSAKLKIVRFSHSELPFDDVFDKARNLTLAAMVAVSLSQPTPADFPSDLYPYFERFGKSLKSDESIEFPSEGERPGFKYDQKLRRHLILRSGAKSYTEPVVLRGSVVEVDDQRSTFTLRLPDGKTYKAPYKDKVAWREKVIRAMEKRASARVLIQATGVFDGNEQLTGIKDPGSFEFLEANDVDMRIDELLALKDGWYDGVGTALSSAGLVWLRNAFADHWPDEVALPFLYPTAEGGIRAEWSAENWEINAEIELDTKNAIIGASPLGEGDFEETAFDLSVPMNWKNAAEWIGRFAPTEPATVGGTA